MKYLHNGYLSSNPASTTYWVILHELVNFEHQFPYLQDRNKNYIPKQHSKDQIIL